ncbi:MAG: DegT/DnrJ/EryC1/StrS family aminotransferase [bacterium]|nr:DegT/DnrJ/EryC1/StrS family aminotransferase [bacterium]
MKIPFVDLPRQSKALEAETLQAMGQVYRSGQYILGPQVEAFEGEISTYLQIPYSIGVASGTEAIFLALKALGIGPGDEVITTAFSFIAPTEMILALGATPVFADIVEETFSIDPASVEASISPKTKAVLVVHLFGAPVDMKSIGGICDRHKLFLIEDCCQAFGASYQGKKVGTLGDVGCFSFYPTKVLGGLGDGGLITTAHEDLANTLRALRHHGSRAGEEHYLLGWNSRLDEIQAAVLRVRLKFIDSWIMERKKLAKLYQKHLEPTKTKIPNPSYGEDAIYQNYTIRIKNREAVRKALNTADIETMVYYPRTLDQIPAVRRKLKSETPVLPKAEKVCEKVLSLPFYPGLSEAEVERVCQVLRDFEK